MRSLIAAAMLLALLSPANAAPKGEWHLIFNVTMCDRFGCDPKGPRGGGTYYTDVEDTEAYFTKKQCLAMRAYLKELFNHATYEDYRDDPLYKRALVPYSKAADETNGGFTKKVIPRCAQRH